MPHPPGANQPDSAASRGRASRADSISIRVPRPDDAARLAEVNIAAWRSAYGGIVPDTYLDTLDLASITERWAGNIEKPPSERFTLVAEIDGAVASYTVAGPYRTQQDAKPEDTTDWGELFAIYTHPDHQGRGAGRALLDVVISELARRGHSTAALWVLRDNSRARDWYAAHGWHEDGATSTWLGAGVPLQEVRLSRRIPTRER